MSFNTFIIICLFVDIIILLSQQQKIIQTNYIKACSQKACIKCCTDPNCEGHRDAREKESIINGTHPINQMANAKRALTIKPGVFRDPAFKYMGESILIWSLTEYMANTKWKDEAIRKSLRNIESIKQAQLVEREKQKLLVEKKGNGLKKLGNMDTNNEEIICARIRRGSRRQRFRRIMNELYEQSLKQN